jgi:hypothetical protein
MSRTIKPSTPDAGDRVLSIEQLEEGLRLLGRGDIDQNAFWDENIEAFRQTVLLAIRETSDALLSPRIPLRWSLELETQLEALVQYVELADRYIARRSVSREARVLSFQPAGSRIH